MGILKTFDIKRLRPFRKSAEHLTDSPAEIEQMRGVDPDLRPEEASYVRHFLGFADIFLKHDREKEEEEEKVVQVPHVQNDQAA